MRVYVLVDEEQHTKPAQHGLRELMTGINQDLQRAGVILVLTQPEDGLMHVKLVIIDAKLAWLGSANLSVAAMRRNDELVMRMWGSRSRVGELRKKAVELWAAARERSRRAGRGVPQGPPSWASMPTTVPDVKDHPEWVRRVNYAQLVAGQIQGGGALEDVPREAPASTVSERNDGWFGPFHTGQAPDRTRTPHGASPQDGDEPRHQRLLSTTGPVQQFRQVPVPTDQSVAQALQKRQEELRAQKENAKARAKALKEEALPPDGCARVAKPPPTCDKCDGKHPTDRCPYFRKAREEHPDSKAAGGGQRSLLGAHKGPPEVLRAARVVRHNCWRCHGPFHCFSRILAESHRACSR